MGILVPNYISLLSSDNSQFRLIDKINNMLDFIAHRNLILNHQQGIENTCIALIDDTISMADMLNDLFTYSLM